MRYNRGMDNSPSNSENQPPEAETAPPEPGGVIVNKVRETGPAYGAETLGNSRAITRQRSLANLTPFDSTRAKSAGARGNDRRRMRSQLAKVQALRGLRIGTAGVADGVKTWGDAVRVLAGQMAVAAYEGDSRAFRELTTAAGLRDKEVAETVAAGSRIDISITGTVAEDLLRALLDRR